MNTKPIILEKEPWLDALVTRKYSFRFTAYGHIKEATQANIGPRVIPDHHFTYYGSISETRCIIENSNFFLKRPDILWLSPGTLHHFSPMAGEPKHSTYWLRFFLGENETPFAIDFPFLKTDSLNGIPGMINDILPLVALEGETDIFRARCMLANILAYTLSSVSESEKQETGLTERQKRHTIDFISKNIRVHPSTAEIAKEIGLSADYFSRKFTKTFKMPVQSFIKKERIKFAGHILLESDKSISETAYYLGFSDIYYFSHQFKDVMGLSPREWRENKTIPRK